MSASLLLGEHPTMVRLRADIERAARSDLPVVVYGETGVGKELVAAELHRAMGSQRPFVPLNVSAVPEQLAEAELFGVGRGAYTGAGAGRPGLIEAAAGGVLFLDECADLSRGIQAKLLRTLDSGEVRRVGANESRRVHFRLALSAQTSPERLVDSGCWREDFHYRVSGIVIQLPTLRERASDIPLLVNSFLREQGRQPVEAVSLADLASLPWRGNVRQLRRTVDRAIFEADGAALTPARLVAAARSTHRQCENCESSGGVLATRREAEAQHLREALARCEFNANRAAAVLDVSVSQLYRLMERYGIEPARRRSPDAPGVGSGPAGPPQRRQPARSTTTTQVETAKARDSSRAGRVGAHGTVSEHEELSRPAARRRR